MLPDPAGDALAGLSAGQVHGFVLSRGTGAKSIAGGLRSFLRYLFLSGATPRELAGAVPPAAAWNAVGLSHLARPPGLWFMAVMAVMFLDVKRRGRSTLRIAAAAGGSLAIAGIVNLALPGWDRHPPVSLGAAAVAALAAATALFAGRWLDPVGTRIAAAAAIAAAAGLVAALAIAGQPFTALAAGACLGIAVTTTVEVASRLPWGRWLADPPRPTTGHA